MTPLSLRTDAVGGHIRGVQRVDHRRCTPASFHGLPPNADDEYGLLFLELADGSRVTWATTDLGYWQALIDSSWAVELEEPPGVSAAALALVFPLSRPGWLDDWEDSGEPPVEWTPTSPPSGPTA